MELNILEMSSRDLSLSFCIPHDLMTLRTILAAWSLSLTFVARRSHSPCLSVLQCATTFFIASWA